MLTVGLICVVGIAFFLVCLRGFQAALKERRTIWAVLITTEKEHEVIVPHREVQPHRLSKAA